MEINSVFIAKLIYTENKDPYINVAHFFSFEEAISWLKEELDGFKGKDGEIGEAEFKEYFDCEIEQTVYNPTNLIEEKIKLCQGATYHILDENCEHFTCITSFDSDYFTEKDLTEYHWKFHVGDIVNCFDDDNYNLGKYVIYEEPERYQDFLKRKFALRYQFSGGYKLIGINLYSRTPHYDHSSDVEFIYDEDIRLCNDTIEDEFFQFLRIFALSKRPDKFPCEVDDFYEIYFVKKDYKKFAELKEYYSN